LEIPGKNWARGLDFAVQLRVLEQAPSKSQGCDLGFRLSFILYQDVEDLDRAAIALLNLLIRGIDLIVPFERQIVYLEVNTEQPQILQLILRLLTTRMDHMARSPKIKFTSTALQHLI
jgi:hypothetical protein